MDNTHTHIFFFNSQPYLQCYTNSLEGNTKAQVLCVLPSSCQNQLPWNSSLQARECLSPAWTTSWLTSGDVSREVMSQEVRMKGDEETNQRE